MNLFNDDFDLSTALHKAENSGYFFAANAVTSNACRTMQAEIANLTLEAGDHVAYPINKGASNEVRQFHERAYRPIGHVDVLVASAICIELADLVSRTALYPELDGWLPTEIGYQRYRHGGDWISPHRDRSSDKLLSVTFTIAGSAPVRIYESDVNPPDYSRLRPVDEFLTGPGTVMFLRAPGFGSGEQVIHEVLPPVSDSRLILNLRMRETILKPPNETKWR